MAQAQTSFSSCLQAKRPEKHQTSRKVEPCRREKSWGELAMFFFEKLECNDRTTPRTVAWRNVALRGTARPAADPHPNATTPARRGSRVREKRQAQPRKHPRRGLPVFAVSGAQSRLPPASPVPGLTTRHGRLRDGAGTRETRARLFRGRVRRHASPKSRKKLGAEGGSKWIFCFSSTSCLLVCFGTSQEV